MSQSDLTEAENDKQIKEISTIKFETKNLGRPLGYLFSFFCFLSNALYLPMLWKFGWIGASIINLTRIIAFYLDRTTSNATDVNIMIMDKNGFNGKEELKRCYIENFKRLIFNYFVYSYILQDAEFRFEYSVQEIQPDRNILGKYNGHGNN